MSFLQPQTYLLGLIGLLGIVAFLVGRQLLKVRRDEVNLIQLEGLQNQSFEYFLIPDLDLVNKIIYLIQL